MFLEGESFCVENNAGGLDGSVSHAAWNLKPAWGFGALHGLLWYPVHPEKPFSPWITSPSNLNFPTTDITMILAAPYLPHRNLGRIHKSLPGKIPWPLTDEHYYYACYCYTILC